MGNANIFARDDLKLALALPGLNLLGGYAILQTIAARQFRSEFSQNHRDSVRIFPLSPSFSCRDTCIGAFRAVGVLLVSPFWSARF